MYLRKEARVLGTLAWDRRSVIADARVRSQDRPCGICGGQSGNGAAFFSKCLGFRFPEHSTNVQVTFPSSSTDAVRDTQNNTNAGR
jgi:hypothetical protein